MLDLNGTQQLATYMYKEIRILNIEESKYTWHTATSNPAFIHNPDSYMLDLNGTRQLAIYMQYFLQAPNR